MLKKPAGDNKQQIGNLLARYKERIQPPQASVEKAFVAAIDTVTGLKLPLEKVTYNVATNTISLQVSALIKSELKTKQSELQTYLARELPAEKIPKIIF